MRLLHPIFPVLLKRPELVMDHVAGYAALAREETAAAASALARRAVGWVVALGGFMAFLVLAGTAALMGAMQGQFHWMMLAIPSCALVIALAGLAAGMHRLTHPLFAELRAHLDADAQALRELGASK